MSVMVCNPGPNVDKMAGLIRRERFYFGNTQQKITQQG